MNRLLEEANRLLKDSQVDYSFCGGHAIDLFLNFELRKHGDVDVSAYWEDRDSIILYMKNKGWQAYEMCEYGIAHQITDINEQFCLKNNMFFIKNESEYIRLEKRDGKNMFTVSFSQKEAQEFNFVEFLFNSKTETEFCYGRNPDITLALSKVKKFNEDIPYLTPEMVLLYKSTDITREGYQLDFDTTIQKMSKEQKRWLSVALAIMNPLGHPWITSSE